MKPTKIKYDRDKLVNLLAERATFERLSVGLYDALLERIADVDDEIITSAIGDLERYRDDERNYAEWLEGLLRKLGGHPSHGLTDAVTRESRALEEVIRTERNGAGLLPMLQAMVAAELLDVEGWQLLLDIAESAHDRLAIEELRPRVEREHQHLALVKRLFHALAKGSVRPHDGERSTAESPAPARSAARGRGEALNVRLSELTHATTDHEKIRRWVEERGGTPSHVIETGGDGDIGILRIDFPGFSGGDTLEAVDWDTWFRAFDENELALVYEEKTASGRPSRFNKLVARETVRRRRAGEQHASARGRRRGSVRHASR